VALRNSGATRKTEVNGRRCSIIQARFIPRGRPRSLRQCSR
jgi:hypothetical protein